ncbi:hypothetical protein CEXT_582961 [Caerostris extrusa]|uniref:Uncharacterized protein n=1 Tax=Caerostris extrusa TaxID=172846 RepID=A0AAV4R062_CAEEX|nr:hypothetical protein CEXT_582961 [Caerostris extrusa]
MTVERLIKHHIVAFPSEGSIGNLTCNIIKYSYSYGLSYGYSYGYHKTDLISLSNRSPDEAFQPQINYTTHRKLNKQKTLLGLGLSFLLPLKTSRVPLPIAPPRANCGGGSSSGEVGGGQNNRFRGTFLFNSSIVEAFWPQINCITDNKAEQTENSFGLGLSFFIASSKQAAFHLTHRTPEGVDLLSNCGWRTEQSFSRKHPNVQAFWPQINCITDRKAEQTENSFWVWVVFLYCLSKNKPRSFLPSHPLRRIGGGPSFGGGGRITEQSFSMVNIEIYSFEVMRR